MVGTEDSDRKHYRLFFLLSRCTNTEVNLDAICYLYNLSKIMANWSDSYLGKLRQVVGDRLLLLFGVLVIIENNLGRVLLQKRSDFKGAGIF